MAPKVKKRQPVATQPIPKVRKSQPVATKKKPATALVGTALHLSLGVPAGVPASRAVQSFLHEYGFKLPVSTAIGADMHRIVSAGGDDEAVRAEFEAAPTLRMRSLTSAKKFLKAWRDGKGCERFGGWLAQFRHRTADVELLPSSLSAAVACHKEAATRRNAEAVELEHAAMPCAGTYDSDGGCAHVLVKSPAGEVPFMPQPVADWLYQAGADVVVVVQRLLDGGGAFNAEGEYKTKEGRSAEGGEIVGFWGTEIGSRREQAVLSIDYDMDFAIFITPGLNFASLWQQATRVLQPSGLRLIEHDPGKKYRVCPKKPLAFAPAKEMYQQVREDNPGLSRGKLMKLFGKLWKAGQRAHHPHGANCVDIEVYTVRPKKDIHIRGTKTFGVRLSECFPVVEGVLGPLRIPLLNTPKVLDREYGSQWRRSRVLKAIQPSGCVQIRKWNDPCWRRGVWPAVPLQRCETLLGGYFGARCVPSKSDVPWRAFSRDENGKWTE